VRLDPAAPAPWDAATSLVRLRAAGRSLVAGTVGQVSFAARARQLLAVPVSAVLQGPGGPYVLVASQDRHSFTRRPVDLGRVQFGYAPVLSGLASGERVAVMEAFFIDAERRLGGQPGAR
jgi:multidrug efflux pump subunit AcrA (membrane-fusion protein)